MKTEKEIIEETEFTNILRKYNCSNPNDCMDEIKDKIFNFEEQEETGDES